MGPVSRLPFLSPEGDGVVNAELTCLLSHNSHTAGDSTMFGTVMNYVALRLLGVDCDEPVMVEIRGWIQKHGQYA
jgi:hypothetical protein